MQSAICVPLGVVIEKATCSAPWSARIRAMRPAISSNASSQEICSQVGHKVPLDDVRRIGCFRRSRWYTNSGAAFPLGQSFSPLGWPGSGSIRRILSCSNTTSHPQRERHWVQNAAMHLTFVMGGRLITRIAKRQPPIKTILKRIISHLVIPCLNYQLSSSRTDFWNPQNHS